MEENSETITCKDCGIDFEFTEGERRFYEERRFTPPIRCKPCRQQKKADREARDVERASGGGGQDRSNFSGEFGEGDGAGRRGRGKKSRRRDRDQQRY